MGIGEEEVGAAREDGCYGFLRGCQILGAK